MKTLSDLNKLQAEWMAVTSSDPHAKRVCAELQAVEDAGYIVVTSGPAGCANVVRGGQPLFIRASGGVPLADAVEFARQAGIRTDVAFRTDGQWVEIAA